MVGTSNSPADESRRSLVQKGALATAGIGDASNLVGGVAAEDDEGQDENGQDHGVVEQDSGGQKGLMFTPTVKPNARFAFTSDVIAWVPDFEAVTDNVWSDYDTRIIRNLETDERVLLFVAHAADIGRYDEELGYVVDEEGQRPAVYDLDRNYTLFDDSSALVTVNFIDIQDETGELDDQDWWRDGDG